MFSHEAYEALFQKAGLLDRTGSRGRLALSGKDRRSYLQGLLTNDIESLTPGQGCYAALLTPQGRMISDMRVSELADRLFMDLPAATTETVRQRLSDFIFSEDVEVRDVTTQLSQLGLYGPSAGALLKTVLGSSPTAAFESMGPGDNVESQFGETRVTAIRTDDFGRDGFDILVPAAAAGALSRALLDAGAREVDDATADVTRVEAGRPLFGRDMDETTIPLEAGIEDRAISLTKGCYVGQEIIIRVLHRGQGRVARRLVGLVGPSGSTLVAGAQLEADGRQVGAITSAVDSPRLKRQIALGYVHRDFTDPGRVLDVRLDDRTNGTVTVVPLPFSPPAD